MYMFVCGVCTVCLSFEYHITLTITETSFGLDLQTFEWIW